MASTSPSPGDATAPPAAAAPPAASVPPQATATGDIASPKAPAATTANASPVADTNAVGNGTPAVNRALDTSFKDAEKAEIQPNSPQGDALKPIHPSPLPEEKPEDKCLALELTKGSCFIDPRGQIYDGAQ